MAEWDVRVVTPDGAVVELVTASTPEAAAGKVWNIGEVTDVRRVDES